VDGSQATTEEEVDWLKQAGESGALNACLACDEEQVKPFSFCRYFSENKKEKSFKFQATYYICLNYCQVLICMVSTVRTSVQAMRGGQPKACRDTHGHRKGQQ
jgi:hypothetical protein